MQLVERVVDFAERARAPGDLLVNVFQGGEFPTLVQRLRRNYKTVRSDKLEASRVRSSEVYLLARAITL